MEQRWKVTWVIADPKKDGLARAQSKYFTTELDAFNYMSTVFDHMAFLGLLDMLVYDNIALVEE